MFPLLGQTVTEKHKLNVPETMTEVLDVSDEEGKGHISVSTVEARTLTLTAEHTQSQCSSSIQIFLFN